MDDKVPGVGERLALNICVALCLTMGFFGVDYVFRHGHGLWLPVVLLTPPLAFIALRIDRALTTEETDR